MADAARAQRQAALEAKKKRLEELKARRLQRVTNNVSAQDAAKAKIAASSNLDQYIDGLLKVPGSSSNPIPTTNSEVVTSSSSNTQNGSTGVDSISKKSEAESSSEHKVADVSAPVQHNAIQIVKTEKFEMGTQTSAEDYPLLVDIHVEEEPQPPPASDDIQDPNLSEATKSNELAEEGVSEAKVLSTEEVEKELASEAFSSFLNVTSKKSGKSSRE
mmetsp:Transcript_4132/g.9343  ORF Transcript_4132/g.9343 Transcript_4132/m.9343 type:complete len:217 (-) Transcript_4132:2386-3036(-)